VHLAFLGLGQIGGSVARAASVAGWASRITAWTPGGAGPRAAAADGVHPSGTAADAIRGADLIVLAAPPQACLELLDALAGPLATDLTPDAVITDVASTKVAIVERARDRGLRFIGGHPMAGREAEGYDAADPDLFADRPWVIVPSDPADPVAEARVSALVEACRARPVRLEAAEHDAAVAAVSHLPLVLSAALVEAIAGGGEWPTAASLAAGGWASMTRLAGGSPSMGAGILATNAPAIAARLRDLQGVLDDWLRLLEAGGDGDGARIDLGALERRLSAARDQSLGARGAARGGGGTPS
jgi:prephenate dehydrogenase